jgi:hypothetical protein
MSTMVMFITRIGALERRVLGLHLNYRPASAAPPLGRWTMTLGVRGTELEVAIARQGSSLAPWGLEYEHLVAKHSDAQAGEVGVVVPRPFRNGLPAAHSDRPIKFGVRFQRLVKRASRLC